jgi:hypothetical protein
MLQLCILRHLLTNPATCHLCSLAGKARMVDSLSLSFVFLSVSLGDYFCSRFSADFLLCCSMYVALVVSCRALLLMFD